MEANGPALLHCKIRVLFVTVKEGNGAVSKWSCLVNRGQGRTITYRSYGSVATVQCPYLLTPWSRVILEKLTGSQLVKKIPAFYGTAFTSACRLSLS